ncbi:MAG: hypothetical protein LC635_01490 [Pseudonocardiaceae bacterium]|nr:hypothetical protein [Pseudonocardiaceae bacterium]
MAFEIINQDQYPGIAASAIQDRQVVAITTGERWVVPIATSGTEPHGIEGRGASAAQGEGVTIMGAGNYCKAIAAASLGAGANVGVVGATRSLGLAAAASGVAGWRVGRSVTPAAAGEVFTFYVSPRQLGGLA